MRTGLPWRPEGSPDASPGPGPTTEPLPPGKVAPRAHSLPTPSAPFPAGELPWPPEQPAVLDCTDPGGEAAGGTGGIIGGRTGGVPSSAGYPVPDK